MTTRVLLADDHKILRQGLQTLLQNEPDIEVVGQADNGRDAIELTKKLQPDVVIMDIAMPDVSGVEATRELLNAVPTAKVVALSMHSDQRFVAGMLAVGASGYLLKDAAFEELALSIRTVVANELYLSPGIVGVVIKDYLNRLGRAQRTSAPTLSSRETEVLRLIAEGRTTAEIAEDLQISVKTVETHRRQVMEKLDLRSIADLTKYALRIGLVSLDSA